MSDTRLDGYCAGFNRPAHEYVGDHGRWSPYFCQDCDTKRVAHIDSQMKDIAAHFVKQGQSR